MQAKWAVSLLLVLVLSACGGLQQQTADLSQILAADPAAKTDADELLGPPEDVGGRITNGCADQEAGPGLLSLRDAIAPSDDETSCHP